MWLHVCVYNCLLWCLLLIVVNIGVEKGVWPSIAIFSLNPNAQKYFCKNLEFEMKIIHCFHLKTFHKEYA